MSALQNTEAPRPMSFPLAKVLVGTAGAVAVGTAFVAHPALGVLAAVNVIKMVNDA